MRIIAAAALAAFIAAAPAGAQDAPPAPPKKQPKICRTVQAATGSRVAKPKTCKTQAQWDAEDADRGATRLRGMGSNAR